MIIIMLTNWTKTAQDEQSVSTIDVSRVADDDHDGHRGDDNIGRHDHDHGDNDHDYHDDGPG